MFGDGGGIICVLGDMHTTDGESCGTHRETDKVTDLLHLKVLKTTQCIAYDGVAPICRRRSAMGCLLLWNE